ncbi:MAG: hypothetical protein ABDH32_07750 [Candidatus Caldarchaeales archaeon]
MREFNGFNFFTLVGVFLILVGIVLILIPFIIKLGLRLENIHPLILVWRKIDGFYIGTSPILLISLIIIYLFLLFFKRA